MIASVLIFMFAASTIYNRGLGKIVEKSENLPGACELQLVFLVTVVLRDILLKFELKFYLLTGYNAYGFLFYLCVIYR